jgi:hypothetical protein
MIKTKIQQLSKRKHRRKTTNKTQKKKENRDYGK